MLRWLDRDEQRLENDLGMLSEPSASSSIVIRGMFGGSCVSDESICETAGFWVMWRPKACFVGFVCFLALCLDNADLADLEDLRLATEWSDSSAS